MMDNEKVLMTLRSMAWERAKGELEGLLHTFWSCSEDETEHFDKVDNLTKRFIKKMDELVT